MNHSTRAPVSFRWLGVAGLEIASAGRTLLVDPYVTRLSLLRLWFGRAESNRALVQQTIGQADFVLVTHAHLDHLLDVPEVLRQTGAVALGSANVCRLLTASRVLAEQTREIKAGDRLTLGNFSVDVLPAEHVTVLGRPVLAGPLPASLPSPPRARDYRMDACFSFLVETGGYRILDWTSERAWPAPPADVLFVKAGQSDAYYRPLLATVQPHLVVPVHWDDFCRPLSRPPRPQLLPPSWAWPPLRRVDLAGFSCCLEQLAPGTRVLLPDALQAYNLGGLL